MLGPSSRARYHDHHLNRNLAHELTMPEIPRDPAFDATLPFLRDPYRYISKRCRELNSDLFQIRLALVRTGICITGPAAAELFYDESKFKRRGVAPRRFQKTLFGKGGVQGLDGEAHRHRKRMFMSLMTPERIARIGQISADYWGTFAKKWAGRDRVVLYDETRELLTRTACDWAEVPLREDEVAARTRELSATFDYAGALGPKHWWARIARSRLERWMIDLIEKCRARQLDVSDDSAMHVVSTHRDPSGNLLDPRIAAVELLNAVRPIVAVSVYLTFAALALHNYPGRREALRTVSDKANREYAHFFAQEVRRFYPFFPAVGAETRCDFKWNGYRFPRAMPVLLDLYGTNHDERAWSEPNEFQPERFRNWHENPFTFVPHGGGDHYTNHRCPGEAIAVELLKVAAMFLTSRASYNVPPQNLEIDFNRVPALPHSQFVIGNVQTR
jgi:fatty-acid peroxygenase